MTTGKINGTIIGLYKVVTGTPDTYVKIANGRSANFDLAVDMIETTEKDSGGFKEYIAGEKGGTFQFEGILEYDTSIGSGAYSFKDLVTDALAGTSYAIRWGTQVTGDDYMQSSVLISGISGSAPNNDVATFSCTMQMTGTISVGTV